MSIPSGQNEERRRRIVNQAVAQFRRREAKQTEVEQLLQLFESAIERVKTHVKQIAKAGGAIKPDDKKALRETVFTMLLQEFDKFHKDALHMFCTAIVADRIMDDVEASPWGSDTPDLLSGK